MPRQARRMAESGIYHVMQRGNGRSILFEDDGDRRFFLSLLGERARGAGVGIMGWCLMENHVHLLLSDPLARLSPFLHGVLTAYAGHFNSRSGHVGSVFQGRFGSVAVESEDQLLSALRYIHMNPEKAGVSRASDYPWSSYGAYEKGSPLLDDSIVLGILGGRDGYLRWASQDGPLGYAFQDGRRIPVEDELEVGRFALGGADPSAVKGWNRAKRDDALRSLRRHGFTIRQIERLTGVGRSTISRHTAGVICNDLP